ncbi:MAG: putative bifunctional diguanylate cyclase/phosphodiesterase [Lautropia sp.]
MRRDHARFVSLVHVFAGSIAIVIALAGPIGYYVVSRNAYERETAIAARLHAAFVNQAIYTTESDWRLQISGLIDADLAPTDLPETRAIIDDYGLTLTSAGAQDIAHSISRQAVLVNNGTEVGAVVVSRSLGPLLVRTGIVSVLSIMLGGAVFGLAAALPLRSLRRTMDALKQSEAKGRRAAEAQLQIVFENAIEGILMFELPASVTSCNPAAARMFGLAPDAVPTVPLTALMRPQGPRGRERRHGPPRPGQPDDAPTDPADPFPVGRIETVAMRPDGSTFPIDVAISESRSGGQHSRIAIVRDITERKQAEARLSYLANFDSLTGLPNRVQFRERTARAMRRADREGIALDLMFLDLDRFKTINDSLGHDVGDRLLQQVGQVLQRCVGVATQATQATTPTTPVIARLGGDEFTVLLENSAGQRAVERIARAILDALSDPFIVGKHELYISASIGIARYPQKHCDLDGLLKQADIAMYHSKALGRNTYRFYNQALDTAASERLELETRLRHALERDEFSLQYQPKADLATGVVSGVEALLRWTPADRAPVGPDRFIPILEDTGLIVPVGAWVLREACEQMMRWRRDGLAPINLAVNLSARQFRQQDLIETIATSLADTGFEAERLEIELTESMLVEHIEEVVRIMARLGAMGVSVAIDDFGTGHSSLSYLKRFDLDTLKVDRSFVQDTPHDAEDNAITIAVIALAHGLGLRAVAEGVENDEQADFLRAQGCDEIQGYLLSRPLSPADFGAWFRQHQRRPAIGSRAAAPSHRDAAAAGRVPARPATVEPDA